MSYGPAVTVRPQTFDETMQQQSVTRGQDISNRTAQTNLNTLDGMNKARMSYLNSAAYQERVNAEMSPLMAQAQLYSAVAKMGGNIRDAQSGMPIVNGKVVNMGGVSGNIPSYDQFMQSQGGIQSASGNVNGINNSPLGMLFGGIGKLLGGSQSNQSQDSGGLNALNGQSNSSSLPLNNNEIDRLKTLFPQGNTPNYSNAIHPGPGYTGGGTPSGFTDTSYGADNSTGTNDQTNTTSSTQESSNVNTARMPAGKEATSIAQVGAQKLENLPEAVDSLKNAAKIAYGGSSYLKGLQKHAQAISKGIGITEDTPIIGAHKDIDTYSSSIADSYLSSLGIRSKTLMAAFQDYLSPGPGEGLNTYNQRLDKFTNMIKTGNAKEMENAGLGFLFNYASTPERLIQKGLSPNQIKQGNGDGQPYGTPFNVQDAANGVLQMKTSRGKNSDISSILTEMYTPEQKSQIAAYLRNKNG